MLHFCIASYFMTEKIFIEENKNTFCFAENSGVRAPLHCFCLQWSARRIARSLIFFLNDNTIRSSLRTLLSLYKLIFEISISFFFFQYLNKSLFILFAIHVTQDWNTYIRIDNSLCRV